MTRTAALWATILLAGGSAVLAAPPRGGAPAQARTAIAQALADPARADQAGDDARRQAAAVLAFAGVKRGDAVVDYLPGSGYWTRIFTDVVGPRGHVFALWPASGAKYATKALPALQARHLANVTAAVMPGDTLSVGRPVDLVWTVQNYHDIPNDGGAPAALAFDRSVFAALKPGGTYVVIDHAAAPGSGLRDTGTLHRIDPATVRRQVEAAGFRFAGSSDVLANPADDHSAKVFDPAIRGHTDQFVYKFVKPR